MRRPPRSRRSPPALARALAIDRAPALAHAARAFLSGSSIATAAADEALSISAGIASAHDRSAWLGGLVHLAAGSTGAGLRVLEAGLVLDPLSPNLAIARALAFCFADRHEEALAAARELTEAEPEFPAAHALRADVAATIERHEEALRSATIADELGRGDQMTRMVAPGLRQGGEAGDGAGASRGLRTPREESFHFAHADGG
jgi:tetratricopeptide (TPR) repeat protein